MCLLSGLSSDTDLLCDLEEAPLPLCAPHLSGYTSDRLYACLFDSKLFEPGTQLPAPLVSLQKGVGFFLYYTLFPKYNGQCYVWMIGFTDSLEF